MRKRLRKKKDKQAVLDSIDWWAAEYLDAVNECMDKMRQFRERWTKRIALAEAKQE